MSRVPKNLHAALAEAWSKVPRSDKADFAVRYPDLWSVCIWVAAEEVVKRDMQMQEVLEASLRKADRQRMWAKLMGRRP